MDRFSWPPDFPQIPLRASYGVNAQPQIISTDMESGPPERSLISHIRVSVINVSYYFAREKFADFVEFFWSPTGANGGQNYFDLPVKTQSNFVPHSVRIISSYQESFLGEGIQVSFSVETDESFN